MANNITTVCGSLSIEQSACFQIHFSDLQDALTMCYINKRVTYLLTYFNGVIIVLYYNSLTDPVQTLD